MTLRTKAFRAMVSVACLAAGVGTLYFFAQKFFALPFRDTNDKLHGQNSPVTLDFLIPGGTYVDPTMTIGEVARLRFKKPGNTVASIADKVSQMIPVKYRLLGTATLYLFWTFLFFIFFRVFTWMGYTTALAIAFLGGAALYFFVPDLVAGRVDDTVFAGWALFFLTALRWLRKRDKGGQSS
jgi:hypothetical protein